MITDIEDKYSSAKDVPSFHYPIVQAEITEYSTYTVVSRLKSSTPYIITSYGGSFNLPEYPDVCLIIPEKAVTPEAQIPLKIKVGVDLKVVMSPYLSTPEIAPLVTVLGPVCIFLSVQWNAYDATVSVYRVDIFGLKKKLSGFYVAALWISPQPGMF